MCSERKRTLARQEIEYILSPKQYLSFFYKFHTSDTVYVREQNGGF